MNSEADTPKISPAEYKEILQKVDLESIALEECSVKVKRKNIRNSMQLAIKSSANHIFLEAGKIEFTHEYELISFADKKKEYAMKINCSYKILLTSEADIHEDFPKIFAKVNLSINTWPYFREFVQNMVQRINFPPLTLPLLK